MAIKVTNRVELYPTNKNDPNGSILVHSHWAEDTKIEIEIEGKRYCVSGQDMIQAVQNSMNINRFGR